MVPMTPLANFSMMHGRVHVARLADGRVDRDAGLGVDLLDLAADQEAGHVEIVDGHVQEHAAGDLDVGDGRRRRDRG